MKSSILTLMLMASAIGVKAQLRQTYALKQWDFSRDSTRWEQVTVPHDWAISGPFDKKWDMQRVAITQNGEKTETLKTGRTGALPWIGKGYYKTVVHINKLNNKTATLIFDGAMSNPTIYVNGKYAGHWANGYTPFRIDVTSLLHTGDNDITVSLNNREKSSRWYPGAGLYRPVSLLLTTVHPLSELDTYIRTLSADQNIARLAYETSVTPDANRTSALVLVTVHDAQDKIVATKTCKADATGNVRTELTIPRPQLWSPESPYLYTVKTTLKRGGRIVDALCTKTGIRTISIDSIHGFRLNGVPRKFKGVCLHHDLGPLGTAVNKAALIRQVKQLKDMGADAIRTSHNLPSQMQMAVYDSLGMMVMAESFDSWKAPKVKNGYNLYYDQWSAKDLKALILNNRNHPSVVLWSIGNEIPEQGRPEGKDMAKYLQSICHHYDPSRPVTQGIDLPDAALHTGFAQVMDVPGFNYRVNKYDNNIKHLGTGYLLGSETASTVSTRGVYKFPVTFQVVKEYPDGQCSGYDTEWCSWSNLPAEDFMAEQDRSYVLGQFVWTGYDYLGEPTPYDTYWPSRSSYFGMIDLAGIPKDRYYLYRSVWNKEAHTLHILPHWTWHDRVGKVTPVFVYTDYPEAELFVNGKSQGRVRKDLNQHIVDNVRVTGEMAQQHARRYRLMWDKVTYEPGELRVVAYDADGHRAEEAVVRTAGQAHDLKLTTDRKTLKADGEDLAFVTVSLIDNKGTELPTANDLIQVKVSGQGKFRAICNGDATSTEVFTEPQMHLFSGKLVVVVQSGTKAGTVKVDISCPSLHLNKTLTLRSR